MNQYYPYHVKRILVVNNPWILGLLWRVVSPWLDTDTRDIIHFLSELPALAHFIPPEHLLPEHGGLAPEQADPADLLGLHTLSHPPLSDAVRAVEGTDVN